MGISKQKDFRLRIGNLFLAIWLATVPTAITYATLGFHGLNICKKIGQQSKVLPTRTDRENCDAAAWETTRSYIFLIGFFITIPTWFWTYMSMKKKEVEEIRRRRQSK